MPPCCLKQIFSKNSAATFFVSGLIRPYHKLKFLKLKEEHYGIFASAIDTLKILVIALGAGLGAWGVVNLLEGYGMITQVQNPRGSSSLWQAEVSLWLVQR